MEWPDRGREPVRSCSRPLDQGRDESLRDALHRAPPPGVGHPEDRPSGSATIRGTQSAVKIASGRPRCRVNSASPGADQSARGRRIRVEAGHTVDLPRIPDGRRLDAERGEGRPLTVVSERARRAPRWRRSSPGGARRECVRVHRRPRGRQGGVRGGSPCQLTTGDPRPPRPPSPAHAAVRGDRLTFRSVSLPPEERGDVEVLRHRLEPVRAHPSARGRRHGDGRSPPRYDLRSTVRAPGAAPAAAPAAADASALGHGSARRRSRSR